MKLALSAVYRKLEVSASTYHRWRQEMVKRLKALEKENTKLKKLVEGKVVGAAQTRSGRTP